MTTDPTPPPSDAPLDPRALKLRFLREKHLARHPELDAAPPADSPPTPDPEPR